jgi:cyclopropane fatty-acyl-phospholipid synthase-like methyltransferase
MFRHSPIDQPVSNSAGNSVDPHPAIVSEYYDAWTEKYVESFGECIQAHRPSREGDLLEYLMTRTGLRSGQRVLDAGCGICGPARYFAGKRELFIEALTVSPVQATMARSLNQAAGLEQRIRVSLGDFHDLVGIYGREQFNVVYFLESLSHASRPAEVIRSAHEVLLPGGIIYIKDFFIRPCDSEEEQRSVLEVIARVDRLFAVKTAWAAEIKDHLRRAGFLPLFASKPQFEVDNSRWQQFESRHHFDLFDGQDSFDWSEWWEMKSQKP